MQIFELHFNPKIKEDYFFDSFIYEPEKKYEKRLGNLYLVGEIKNANPKNSKFLENIANNIKEEYYSLTSKSSQQSLTNTLKKTNEFLAKQLKMDNVSWL